MTTWPAGRTNTALWKSMFRSSLKTDQPNRFGRCRRFIAASILDVEHIVVTPIALQIHCTYPKELGVGPSTDRSALLPNNHSAVANPRSMQCAMSTAMCHGNCQRCCRVFSTIDGSLSVLSVRYRFILTNLAFVKNCQIQVRSNIVVMNILLF